MAIEPDTDQLLASYRAATEPEGVVANRLVAEADAYALEPQPRRGRIALLVAATCLAAVVVGGILATPPEPEPAAAFSTPIAIPPGHSTPRRGVQLTADGVGATAFHLHQVHLSWTVGTLDVEVDPAEQLDVRLDTDDGTVSVVGTGFRVVRNALGTEVAVRHGLVEVRCGHGMATSLPGGSSRLCVPLTAAGLLGRAQALEQQGAPPVEWRVAAEAGLADPLAPAPVRGELETVRIRSMLADGRVEDALAAARAYLDAGYPERRGEVLAVAVQLAETAGHCELARVWRAELPTTDPPGSNCPR